MHPNLYNVQKYIFANYDKNRNCTVNLCLLPQITKILKFSNKFDDRQYRFIPHKGSKRSSESIRVQTEIKIVGIDYKKIKKRKFLQTAVWLYEENAIKEVVETGRSEMQQENFVLLVCLLPKFIKLKVE